MRSNSVRTTSRVARWVLVVGLAVVVRAAGAADADGKGESKMRGLQNQHKELEKQDDLLRCNVVQCSTPGYYTSGPQVCEGDCDQYFSFNWQYHCGGCPATAFSSSWVGFCSFPTSYWACAVWDTSSQCTVPRQPGCTLCESTCLEGQYLAGCGIDGSAGQCTGCSAAHCQTGEAIFQCNGMDQGTCIKEQRPAKAGWKVDFATNNIPVFKGFIAKVYSTEVPVTAHPDISMLYKDTEFIMYNSLSFTKSQLYAVNFAIVFEGYFAGPTDHLQGLYYNFVLEHSFGAKVWVNDVEIISASGTSVAPIESKGPMRFSELGWNHKLKIEWWGTAHASTIKAFLEPVNQWTGVPTGPKVMISNGVFSDAQSSA